MRCILSHRVHGLKSSWRVICQEALAKMCVPGRYILRTAHPDALDCSIVWQAEGERQQISDQ
jgi:hypothetical protein